MAQIESSFEPNEDAVVALRTGNYPPFAEFEDGGAGRIINISDYILRGSVSNMRSSDTSDSFYQIWPFEEQQPNTRRL